MGDIRNSKYWVLLSVGAVAVATLLSSCGGGSGSGGDGGSGAVGGASSSSSTTISSSSTVTSASYSAQSTVALVSLATSEQAPIISAPIVLTDGKLIVPTVQKKDNVWNLQAQEYDDKSAPVGAIIPLQTSDTTQSNWDLRLLIPMSSGGFVDIQGANTSDYLVAKTIPSDMNLDNSEYRIAVSGGTQLFSPLKNGKFVAIYNDAYTTLSSKFTIYGQIFDSSTGTGGSYFSIPLVSNTDHDGGFVAPLTTGGFVVSWCDQCYSTSDNPPPPETLFVQTYDQSGQALTSPVSVATGSEANPLTHAEVFGLPTGGFGVIWNEKHTTTSNTMETKIRMQFFSANGTPASDIITVGPPSENREFTSVAVLSSGRIAVLWSAAPLSPIGYEHYDYELSVIDAAGNPVGSDIAIAALSNMDVSGGAIAARSNGGMAIMWQQTILGFCMPCTQNLRLVDPL